MRVTNALFTANTIKNYQKNIQEIHKVERGISSGLQISNSFEDTSKYIDTMRLNYEISTLEQVKKSSSKAQVFTQNTDKILNQFTSALDKFKTKLIQASNNTNSPSSLNAIANELSSLKKHMISLGNTSINGQYLFSGTSFVSKPLDDDGNYSGNDDSMEALIGSGVKLPYNVNGDELFLGGDSEYRRMLSTNAKMFNQSKLHPSVMTKGGALSKEVYLSSSDTIRDMVGDNDSNEKNDPNVMFYLSGRKTDGTTISTKLEISSSSKVKDLLDKIGQEYGNTSTNKTVSVQMNYHGQIEIKDLNKGSTLLEMNIFGAVDRDAIAGTSGNADQSSIDDFLTQKNVDIIEFNKSNFSGINSVSTVSVKKDIYNPSSFSLNSIFKDSEAQIIKEDDFLQDFMGKDLDKIVLDGTSTAGAPISFTLGGITNTTTVKDLMTTIDTQFGAVSSRLEKGKLYIDDNSGVIPSSFNMTLKAQDNTSANFNAFSTLNGMNYERRGFQKDGNTLTSNITQVVSSSNSFAIPQTKLSEVAGVSLSGKQFLLNGKDSFGNSFSGQIDFNSPKTTFSLDGGATNYTVFNAKGGSTSAQDMTYKQLSDVISLVVSNHLPVDKNIPPDGIQFDEYNKALHGAQGAVEVKLDYRGRLEIHDRFNSKSPIEFTLSDSSANETTNPSALSFMANDSIQIEDPKIDFYKDLTQMIEAVKTGTFRADANGDNPRNIGIQNSLKRIDHLMTHTTKIHTKIGAYSNALIKANERSGLLSINVKTIRTEVIGTDIGAAYIRFNELSNSYQALLSSSAKINSMSLLNYM